MIIIFYYNTVKSIDCFEVSDFISILKALWVSYRRVTQACLDLPLPPYLTMSLHAAHFPQSGSKQIYK